MTRALCPNCGGNGETLPYCGVARPISYRLCEGRGYLICSDREGPFPVPHGSGGPPTPEARGLVSRDLGGPLEAMTA